MKYVTSLQTYYSFQVSHRTLLNSVLFWPIMSWHLIVTSTILVVLLVGPSTSVQDLLTNTVQGVLQGVLQVVSGPRQEEFVSSPMCQCMVDAYVGGQIAVCDEKETVDVGKWVQMVQQMSQNCAGVRLAGLDLVASLRLPSVAKGSNVHDLCECIFRQYKNGQFKSCAKGQVFTVTKFGLEAITAYTRC